MSTSRRRGMELILRLTANFVIICGGIAPIYVGIVDGVRWGAAGTLAGVLLGLAAGVLLAGLLGAASDAVITRFRRRYNPGR
jgi:hypothetical protein